MYYNSEGYASPTEFEALSRIRREENKEKRMRRYKPMVYICSPFSSGDKKQNIINTRRFCKYAVAQNCIPFAPHLLFPQFMDDSNPEERDAAFKMNNIMLGNAVGDYPYITDCTERIKPLHAKYFGVQRTQATPAQHYTPLSPTLSEQEIINKIMNSQNGEKFAALYSGDFSGYPSLSEADMAFCSLLAFWCGGDTDLMDRIYRTSGLMRDKWDRRQSGSTYGAITLSHAVAGCQNFYGKVSLPYSNFLGYKKGADGLPEIVPEEAETVRFIYRSFLEGMTPYNICKALMEREILSPGGKKKWCASTVQSILQNEKYKGSAILQKQYTIDYLTKKTRKNEGQLPKYYIEESHEAIISPEEFELVQIEFERRKKLGKHYSGTKTLGSKIVCSDCGGFFGSKVWHSTDKYRKVIWQCNQKFKKDCLCSTPTLNETEVKERFITAFGLFFQKRDIIISAVQEMISALSDFTALDEKLNIAIEEMNYVTELHRLHVKNNRITAQNQEEYDKRSDELQKEYETKKAVYDKLLLKKNSRVNKIKALESLIGLLNQTNSPINEFDENLWHSIIEKVTVYPDKKMIFQFLDGTEIES